MSPNALFGAAVIVFILAAIFYAVVPSPANSTGRSWGAVLTSVGLALISAGFALTTH